MKDLKRGFTLAEVLITLGVISVVAAMTLPTLIQNYKKTAYVNQLKKSYSIWEQVFQKMKADDGVDKLSDTSVWASKGNMQCTYSDTSYTTDNNCKAFINSLNKYIKIIGIEKYGNKVAPLKGTSTSDEYINYNSIVLSDGTMIIMTANGLPTTKTQDVCNQIKSFGGNMCSKAGTIIIDINGKKDPNTWGRDVFWFSFSDEGKLYPSHSKDNALYNKQQALDNNPYYWKNYSSSCINPDKAIPNYINGQGCTTRIMEEGWKMNY